MKRRGAFTLIEVLISVLIIAIVVVGIMQIQRRDIDVAHYISRRSQQALANSLFVGDAALNATGSKKSAYDLLRMEHIEVRNDLTRKILKKLQRRISVRDLPLGGGLALPLRLRSIGLKGDFSSLYYRLQYDGRP